MTKEDEFILNLAHEIKQTSTTIAGYSNLLENDLLSEEEKIKAIKVINRVSRQQNRIVDNLTQYSDLSYGTAVLHKTVFLFRDLIEQLEEEYKLKIEEKGVKFEIINGSRNKVEADRDKLYQVFSNLISNSLKFTDSGQISVNIRYQADNLTASVSDTGCGISDSNTIFDAFSQINKSGEGLGLGLYISSKIVELHNGNIKVSSDSGGTKFTVTIPTGDINSAP